jgi:hypothetical protein
MPEGGLNVLTALFSRKRQYDIDKKVALDDCDFWQPTRCRTSFSSILHESDRHGFLPLKESVIWKELLLVLAFLGCC